MWIKHITSKKIGFTNIRVTMNTFFSFNLILTIVAVPYWMKVEFHWDLLLIGVAGGMSACVAVVCLNVAFITNGPAGPVTAISSISSLLLAIVMAIKDRKALSLIEIISIICGLFGVLIMTNHEFFERYCFCCCFSKKKKDVSKNDNYILKK